MHGPGKIEDSQIKQLLASESPANHKAGLIMLDTKYRYVVSGIIRSWSLSGKIFISADDLPAIWNETFLSVAANVRQRRFGIEGDLKSYLCQIAWCRAVDVCRKRLLTAAEPDMKPARGLSEMKQLMEDIVACCHKLTDKLAVVLVADVGLFWEKFKWASLAELTIEVNRCGDKELTEGTVRARRARAREQLRTFLREREYGV